MSGAALGALLIIPAGLALGFLAIAAFCGVCRATEWLREFNR